ncbi:MAG: hypothetical protein J0H71_06075 [Rhizobiales bacterium]|nr:hypothetical protein [Hyphomicrobiales bacterium]
MDDAVRFGDLVFDKSFLFARRGSSAELKFTRAERAMLLLLTANARKIVTRNRLLDAAGVPVADADIEAIVSRAEACHVAAGDDRTRRSRRTDGRAARIADARGRALVRPVGRKLGGDE